MKKVKIFTIFAAVISLAACFMMFLPQLTMSYSYLTTSMNTTFSGVQTLFGGEIVDGEYRLGVFKGATLGFIGYVFVGSAGVLLLATLFFKKKSWRIITKAFAFCFAGTGLGFVWSTKVNFTYLNDIAEGSAKSAFTINKIGQGYGLIVGILVSVVAVIAIIYSIVVDAKEQ